jgi:hypothetical protein
MGQYPSLEIAKAQAARRARQVGHELGTTDRPKKPCTLVAFTEVPSTQCYNFHKALYDKGYQITSEKSIFQWRNGTYDRGLDAVPWGWRVCHPPTAKWDPWAV